MQGGLYPRRGDLLFRGFLYVKRMRHLDKCLYRRCIKDAEAFKALALFVYVKQHKPCSVFPDYNLSKFSSFCGLSKNTTRKRLNKLVEMGLVERVGKNEQHLLFKKARKKHANVIVSRVRYGSVKETELALRAILVCEIQRSKDWLEQRVYEAYSPEGSVSYTERKRSLGVCRKRGVTTFTDNGISWRTISKRLNCSFFIVRNVLDFGEKNLYFKVNRRIVERNEVSEFLKYSDEPNCFITKSGRIFQAHCNTFTLLHYSLHTH